MRTLTHQVFTHLGLLNNNLFKESEYEKVIQ